MRVFLYILVWAGYIIDVTWQNVTNSAKKNVNLILYEVVVTEQGDLVDLPTPLKKQFTPNPICVSTGSAVYESRLFKRELAGFGDIVQWN